MPKLAPPSTKPAFRLVLRPRGHNDCWRDSWIVDKSVGNFHTNMNRIQYTEKDDDPKQPEDACISMGFVPQLRRESKVRVRKLIQRTHGSLYKKLYLTNNVKKQMHGVKFGKIKYRNDFAKEDATDDEIAGDADAENDDDDEAMRCDGDAMPAGGGGKPIGEPESPDLIDAEAHSIVSYDELSSEEEEEADGNVDELISAVGGGGGGGGGGQTNEDSGQTLNFICYLCKKPSSTHQCQKCTTMLNWFNSS